MVLSGLNNVQLQYIYCLFSEDVIVDQLNYLLLSHPLA